MSASPSGQASTQDREEGGASESTQGTPSPALVETRECQNCGRRFIGDYCSSCGQEAVRSPSILEVVSIFFRELIDIEDGLWRTLRDLTLRPGPALSSYLRGARKWLMHPGRYLLAAIVVAFGARQVFTWIGAREPYDEQVSGTIPEAAPPEMGTKRTGGIQSAMVSTAEQVIESQGFLVASYLLLAGLLSLAMWRLLRPRFEQGFQAVAFSVYVIAQTVFLVTAARLLYVPTVYLSSGGAAEFPSGLTYGITAVYVAGVVPWVLGGGWKASGKGLFALGWAAFEGLLILGIVVGGVLLWRIHAHLPGFSPTESARIVIPWGDTTTEIGLLYVLALPVVPLIFHAAVETYYRLR